MIGKRLPASKEEKVAKRLADLVNDYNLNIEEVGRYLARVGGLVSNNRLAEIILVAEEEKEIMEARRHHDPLF